MPPKRKSNDVEVEEETVLMWAEEFVRDMKNEDLIAAIEVRPAIWDSRTDDYNDYVARESSWSEVCVTLDKEFEQRSSCEKNIIRKQMIKKWKNLKDSYNRECRRIKIERRGGLKRKRHYIHFKQMKFLEPISTLHKPQSDGEGKNEEEVLDVSPKQKSVGKTSLLGNSNDLISNVDNIDLISAIQEQPSIWDHRVPEYNDNLVRDTSWYEVCKKADEDFENRTPLEKNMIRKLLSRRWKSLRDSYIRECKRAKALQNAGVVDRKRPYIYTKQLQFLDPVFAIPMAQSDLDDNEEDSSDISFAQQAHFLQVLEPSQSMYKIEGEEVDIVKALAERVLKQSGPTDNLPTNDCDTLFFLSLVDDFKKVPEHMKMVVKSQIMNVIHQNQVHPYQ